MRLTRSGQVADFGMTKQMEIGADQNASHSSRTSSTTEAAPTAIMTSVLGTGMMPPSLWQCCMILPCCAAVTAQYMAPELCDVTDSTSTNLTEYGSYIDQYSFGCARCNAT